MSEVANDSNATSMMAQRFRGFLPVVIDIETGGFNAATDAMLEIAGTLLDFDDSGRLNILDTHTYHVEPFEGANLDPSALEFTGIDPDHPFRGAEPEAIVLPDLFSHVRKQVKAQGCNRAVLVGHNAHFDLGFLTAAVNRCSIKRNPFHPFSVLDTASLSALAFGHTVLAKACELAGVDFDNNDAHSAEYDSVKTAELFCTIVNRWHELGGWTPENP